MSQSRKTRQPDRFMLYMTLMLMLWVVVFVTVLFTQAIDPRNSSTPPAPTNTRPNAPNNPFSSGQFASPEDSRFIPRPRRLEPVQLPPARAYNSIVFGDMPFNLDDFDTQQDFNAQQDFDAQQDEQTALATQPNPAVGDASSNPADTNPDTSDTKTTETASIDSGDSDSSGDNTDVSNVATAEVTTTNIDVVNTDDITNVITDVADNIAVNADTDTPRTTSNTPPDAPDTLPTTSLELIPDINTSVARNIPTPPNTANDTADGTADDITPIAQTDLASSDSNLSPTKTPDSETPDNETPEDTADTPIDETSGTAAGAPTNTSTLATNEPATNEPATNEPAINDTMTPASNSPFADVRLEPPPLLPAEDAAPVATPNLITVTFTSQPSGAEVLFAEEVLGRTPLELRLPAEQDIFYTLAMPSSSSGSSGFRRFSSVVRSSEDTTVAVQLEPISNTPATTIEGFGTTSALRGDRANARVVRDTVAELLEQATAEYQAAISDRRIARLQAEIDALEAELARLDAVLAAPEEDID